MTQLPFRSATELAAAIRGKEISSTELVECCLDRIEALNPGLGAVVTVAAERLARRPVRPTAASRGPKKSGCCTVCR